MKPRGKSDWIPYQDGVVLAVLSIEHMACCSVYWPRIWHAHIQTIAGYATVGSIANWRWFKQAFNKICKKSTLVARGADTQLWYSCVSAPLATNVDLWNPIGCVSLMKLWTINLWKFGARCANVSDKNVQGEQKQMLWTYIRNNVCNYSQQHHFCGLFRMYFQSGRFWWNLTVPGGWRT